MALRVVETMIAVQHVAVAIENWAAVKPLQPENDNQQVAN